MGGEGNFPLDIVSRSSNSGVGTNDAMAFSDPKQTIFETGDDGGLVFNRKIHPQSLSPLVVVVIGSRSVLNEWNATGSKRKKRLHSAYKVERKISFLCK